MKDFSGRTAVVTGGASGMGEAMARALASEGCNVAIADIVEENAEAVAASINSNGGRAVAIACDISQRGSVRAMRDRAAELLGPVSLVFANAGVTVFKPLTEMTDDEIDWVLEVDLHGVFHCLKTFLPDMIAAGEGHIVATSSVSGLLSSYIDNHAPYIAAKAGVIAMMLSMRRELEGSGVGVSVLCPGKVTTNIAESFRYRPERFGGPNQDSVDIPHGENSVGARTPAEVAEMVLHAVRQDRAVVVTDASMKDLFQQGYCNAVLTAFDDAADWDNSRN